MIYKRWKERKESCFCCINDIILRNRMIKMSECVTEIKTQEVS
jgi:hypothetical protein